MFWESSIVIMLLSDGRETSSESAYTAAGLTCVARFSVYLLDEEKLTHYGTFTRHFSTQIYGSWLWFLGDSDASKLVSPLSTHYKHHQDINERLPYGSCHRTKSTEWTSCVKKNLKKCMLLFSRCFLCSWEGHSKSHHTTNCRPHHRPEWRFGYWSRPVLILYHNM